MGLPGGKKAAATGYISGENLTTVIDYSREFERFGGVMIWEMTTLYDNQGFLDTVVTALSRSTHSTMKSKIPPENSSATPLVQKARISYLSMESDASAISWKTQTSRLFYASFFLIIIFHY